MNTPYGLRRVCAGIEHRRQLPKHFREPTFECINRLMIHARSDFLSRHPLERCQQIPFREDLVIQSEPFPSLHSLFESRQHGNGPSGRFEPCPAGADPFDLLSPTGAESSDHSVSNHPSSLRLFDLVLTVGLTVEMGQRPIPPLGRA